MAFWPTGTNVTVGSPIKPAQINSIITVVGNASKVKCRNEATNSSSNQTNGSYSSGLNSCGTTGITCPNGLNQNGVVANIYNTNYCESGTKQNGKDTYSACTNGYHTSYCYIGGQSHNCQNVQCTSGKHTSYCWSGKHSCGDLGGYSTGKCDSGTCSSGTDQNATCQHTTCSNVSKTCGLHSNTKTIDILCVHTNKTNG